MCVSRRYRVYDNSMVYLQSCGPHFYNVVVFYLNAPYFSICTLIQCPRKSCTHRFADAKVHMDWIILFTVDYVVGIIKPKSSN